MNFFTGYSMNTPGRNQEILRERELLGVVRYFQPERGDGYRSQDEPRVMYIAPYDARINQCGHRVIVEADHEDLKVFVKMLHIILDPGQEVPAEQITPVKVTEVPPGLPASS